MYFSKLSENMTVTFDDHRYSLVSIIGSFRFVASGISILNMNVLGKIPPEDEFY